jgi:hypothetical protein
MPYKMTSPHDVLFGNAMERREVAQSFFMAHLPDTIKEALAWETLKIAESARRSSGSKTRYTDICYTCCTKKEGIPIYIHPEQQREVDASIVERIIRYNADLYSQHRRQGNKKLPIIANLLVYNNTKPRNHPYYDQISDYFEIPWMAKILSEHYFYLISLNKESDEVLASHGHSGPMELLLKRAWETNFVEWLREHSSLLKDILVSDMFSLYISYALAVGRGKAEDIIEAFLDVYPQQKESSKQVVLLPPTPLRTQLASFPALRSSLLTHPILVLIEWAILALLCSCR